MNETTTRIVKTPNVCGGGARIDGTRYTVWGLVEWQRLGMSDAQLLEQHPSLTPEALNAAWDYARRHPDEIERALWENEACMVEHDGRHVPPELVQRGRDLGLSDETIRNAFHPPLESQAFAALPRPSGEEAKQPTRE